MSRTIPWPGPARLTLVLLAAVPAVMAAPWQTVRERWVLGVAIAIAVVLLSWWQGLHLTTLLRRRAAMLRGGRPVASTGTDVRAAAALRITPPADSDPVPMALLAEFLDRYGIRADTIRVTSLDRAGERQTWIALTLSAAANLAALQARSSSIPLAETVEVAARRLADQLRELGWEVTTAGAEDIPQLVGEATHETWNAVRDGAGYLSAYRVNPDDALPQVLSSIEAQRSGQRWTAVELAQGAAGRTVAAACALRTDQPPGAPPAGLIPQRGIQRAALRALHPLSTERLEGHAAVSDEVVSGLRWSSAAVG